MKFGCFSPSKIMRYCFVKRYCGEVPKVELGRGGSGGGERERESYKRLLEKEFRDRRSKQRFGGRGGRQHLRSHPQGTDRPPGLVGGMAASSPHCLYGLSGWAPPLHDWQVGGTSPEVVPTCLGGMSNCGFLAASEESAFVQWGAVSRTVTDTFSARSDITNSTSPWLTRSSI